MANDLAIFEDTLRPLTPHFEQALGGAMPVERLMRTIMISIERSPKLLQANRQSLINSAMSAACLGLEVDGVTGQGFLVPFAGKAQLIIGYKGYNTLGARSGLTIQGQVVREGDAFDYELGDKGFVRHKPKLGNKAPIIAAWATASSLSRPSIVEVLGYDDLLAIRDKSPAVKGGFDTPWKELTIGFPAMCAKSVKRRLARSTPMNSDPRFHQAAAMEEAHEERGKLSWISPERGVQIEGEIVEDRPQIHHEQRSTVELLASRETFKSTDIIPTAAAYSELWRVDMMNATKEADAVRLGKKWNAEKVVHKQIEWTDEHPFDRLKASVMRAIESLKADTQAQ